MKPIKFTIDETYFAAAVCSLKASIKNRGVKTIKCRLTKTRLKIDCAEWGCAVIPAKSEAVASFLIPAKSLNRAGACYSKYKDNRTEVRAVLDKEREYFKTSKMWIEIL